MGDDLTRFRIKFVMSLFFSAGVSVTSSNTGVPDISGSVYTKTQVAAGYDQDLCSRAAMPWFFFYFIFYFFFRIFGFFPQSFEKQGFHAGTPAASFTLPSALGTGGPINPPAAAGYAPAPFMHILTPHQQPHSQILHHHLQQDGQVDTQQIQGHSSTKHDQAEKNTTKIRCLGTRFKRCTIRPYFYCFVSVSIYTLKQFGKRPEFILGLEILTFHFGVLKVWKVLDIQNCTVRIKYNLTFN